MSRKFKRGFTLIELLVVIAIIGVLASVVLVSLQSARKKGNDTRVISGVQQLRNLIESSFSNGVFYEVYYAAGNTAGGTSRYLRRSTDANSARYKLEQDILAQQAAGGITAAYASSDLAAPAIDASVTGSFLITKPGNGDATNGKDYAIYAKLPSDPTKAICVDGKGVTKTVTWPTVNTAIDALSEVDHCI